MSQQDSQIGDATRASAEASTGEPVAWRVKLKTNAENGWMLCDQKPDAHADYDTEPLYVAKARHESGRPASASLMASAAHTPEPWATNNYQIVAGNTVIANCTYGARNSNNVNDARLIAAAPRLLEALKNLLATRNAFSGMQLLVEEGLFEDSQARAYAIAAAEAAIASATGAA